MTSALFSVLFVIGALSMEGKVEHKFDMKPREENIEEYGRLCRERTNKSMIKNRQIQVCQGVCIGLAKPFLFKCYHDAFAKYYLCVLGVF